VSPVPFLWEFHKVHHSANVLTPITAFRVHPVDTWLFANMILWSLARPTVLQIMLLVPRSINIC